MKNIVLIIAVCLSLTLALSTTAQGKAPQVDKKIPVPSLAGFGFLSTEHACKLDYGACSEKCKTDRLTASCAAECLSDCNVCALDFGEEAKDVCQKK
jgi:hypothetical protein